MEETTLEYTNLNMTLSNSTLAATDFISRFRKLWQNKYIRENSASLQKIPQCTLYMYFYVVCLFLCPVVLQGLPLHPQLLLFPLKSDSNLLAITLPLTLLLHLKVICDVYTGINGHCAVTEACHHYHYLSNHAVCTYLHVCTAHNLLLHVYLVTLLSFHPCPFVCLFIC